jgi:hypothetical protein
MRGAALVLLAALAGAAAGQEIPPVVGTQQRGGIYIEPPARVDPVYTPAGPDAPAEVPAGAPPLSLQLALDLPLRGGGSASLGAGVQGSTAASPTLQAQVRWTPVRNSWWFLQATFYRYLQGDRQQAWHPDYSYGFGYDDWHPGTWSLYYGNYTGTRFHPDRAAGERSFNFPYGQWTLAYRFALPAALEPAFLVGDGDRATCNANAHLTPRYTDFETGNDGRRKKALSLGCRYERPVGWYFEAALYAWPDRSQQQPWDPDFTYSFGYADWRPGSVSVRYNNYSGNRYPGRARAPGEGTFRSGSISVWWMVPW